MLRPIDIDVVWEAIKDEVTELTKQTELTAEIVKENCKSGVYLFLLSPEGFVILQTQFNKYNNNKTLFVIMASGKGQVFDKYLPTLISWAKKVGCVDIAFATKRKGFERKLKDKWVAETTYRLEI